MQQAVILSAVRTPIGKFLGSMAGVGATTLGSIAVREAVERAGIDAARVDEVIMGNVVSAGLGQNPARQAALMARLPNEVAALTINKVCGSGLKAVALAAQGIQVGDIDVAVAGGMESMSNAPYLLRKAREGMRLGEGELVDALINDGLWDAYEDRHMGMIAEAVAKKYAIGRDEQDEYALNSHRKAIAAMNARRFQSQIISVPIRQRKGEPIAFSDDEAPRADCTREGLRQLGPAFVDQGTVTSGNASGLSDGAAALVLASQAVASQLGLQPLARIVAHAVSGVEPAMFLMAPVQAIQKLLARTGWSLDEVDLYEINEAFAIQLVALIRKLKLDPARVNVNGGAVALGHPIGASGARILTTLLHEMVARNSRRGIAALCLGGGNAVALAVER